MYKKILAENADPVLDDAYRASHGIVVLNQPFFETCVSYLVSQNNNIPRIRNIVERMCTPFGGRFPNAEELAMILESEDLRLGYRQEYLEKFCCEYTNGRLNALESISPLEVQEHTSTKRPELDDTLNKLQDLWGVGPKVACCIALFSLGYIQCVPRDVWIKRAESKFDVAWDPECAGFQQQLIFYWQQQTQIGKK